jgi:hypothetical protein
MDDYTSNVLTDSKNEWSILLINYLTPHVIDGFRSIFNESVQLCEKNDEIEKYLMTFQNLLSRIPKWNNEMVKIEKERIMKLCNCSYLEDLMTCVHIIQLKILSCVRVGSESKKISIDIPDFGAFLHKVYINVARKLYSNIYLFEIDIASLEIQKRNREFEVIVQACVMNTIRDSIPVETLLRQYIDESTEYEVKRTEPVLPKPPESKPAPMTLTMPSTPVSTPVTIPVTMSPNSTSPMNTLNNSMNSSISSEAPVCEPRISFNEQNEMFQLPEEDMTLQIGEEIPLNTLSFDDLDIPIDLGIVEL